MSFVTATTLLILGANPCLAQDAPASPVTVTLKGDVEEGRKMIVATVERDGKPLEGVRVAFTVRRTFGSLPLGTEDTIDDGTAAVSFPTGLPGDVAGALTVVAEVVSPPEAAGARGERRLEASPAKRAAVADPFPRALWAPRAPAGLVLTITLLLAGVWCTYAYVLLQLIRMRKEA